MHPSPEMRVKRGSQGEIELGLQDIGLFTRKLYTRFEECNHTFG